jgi:hypothetical protein
MIWPMVEQAHFGTTRYTMLSLSVIHVPGKPMTALPLLRVRYGFADAGSGTKNQTKPVYSTGISAYQ